METPTLDVINTNIKQYTNPRFIQSNYPEFYTYLKITYPWIKKISEGMWLYFHNCSRPNCPICGTPLQFMGWSDGYREFCSRKCLSQGTRDKARSTMVERYGAPTSFERDDFQEKCKSTMQERYGVDWAMQSKQIRDKSAKTCLERYGDTKPSRTADVKNKIVSTTTERYGGVGSGSGIIKNKIKQTLFERYGVQHTSQIPGARYKITQTCLERYGGVGVASPILGPKIRATLMERYGVNNPAKSGLLKGLDTIYVDPELAGYDENGDWICKCPHPECDKCTEKQFHTRRPIYYDRKRLGVETCTILNPKNSFTSSIELFIQNILDKHNIKYIHRDRKTIGKELDFYIPDYKLAIECNGIYWHSTRQQTNKNHHIERFELCRQHGIQLLTLWEDWFVNTPDIVESLVLSKLGIYKQRIGARQCNIKYIKNCSKFVSQNHIQGASRSNVHLGMYFKDKLVAVMEFARRSKLSGGKNDNCWELTRFCSEKRLQIVGAAQRLLVRFIRDYDPSKIISFSSNDISNGNVYTKLGFESENKITGAYWYITPSFKRYHRTNFTKAKLIAQGEDPNLSEREIMDSKPIFRIYDSGHIKHTLYIKRGTN